MTKKLEELFDIASQEDNPLEEPIPGIVQEITQEAINNLEKIENALPQVRGLESSDQELDELADLATNSFKDLQDLGMQVDSRFASDIFAAAGNMLGHAITAKTAKLNKKLKMIDLQLKKAQLDERISRQTKEVDNIPLGDGTGKALDRNELLRMLTSKNSDE
jgi:hypothetical protein